MATRSIGIRPDQQPERLDQRRRCLLWEAATQAVPGEGPQHAPLMLVGEQPGDQEDLQGKPFVGPAGALLDRALDEAGVDRSQVYVTNAVKHFKWEPRCAGVLCRRRLQREVEACHYWIERELAEHDPKVVVALGVTALKSILQKPTVKLKASMGDAIEHDGRLVIATFHPSYALRSPDAATRESAYRAMVEAFRHAHRLIEK